MGQSMLEGFALYREPQMPIEQCIVGMPLGSRLHRIIRGPTGWRLWLSTSNFIHGTYLDLFEDGSIERVTVRAGEGDDAFLVRPTDHAIRSTL